MKTVSYTALVATALLCLPWTAQAGGGTCLEDDWVPVEDANSLEREVSKATGHIDFASLSSEPGYVGCTGILVSEDLLLTAAHCLVPSEHGVKSLSAVCDDTSVRFDYTKVDISAESAGPSTYYDCEEIVVWQYYGKGGNAKNNEDYALIRLADDPGDDRGWVDVRLDVDDDATVGMFHHPSGLPKKMSVGTMDDFSPFLAHDLDTCGGSSGAGLLDEWGNVVGVHVADDLAKRLGSYWTSADLEAWGITEATVSAKAKAGRYFTSGAKSSDAR